MKITIEFDEELSEKQMELFPRIAEGCDATMHGGIKRYTLSFDYAWQLARVMLDLALATFNEELPMITVVQDEPA